MLNEQVVKHSMQQQRTLLPQLRRSPQQQQHQWRQQQRVEPRTMVQCC
jgi:hypothetical protein